MIPTFYQAQGAALANDGIPLHFGDPRREYHAALDAAVLMDRSHEGRFELAGRDRLDLMHRISTNDLLSLPDNAGRPTIFTNPNARILDRALVINRGERALVIAEPGRGEPLRRYLQRNIFFNDDAQIADLSGTTRQFVLHGATADAVVEQFAPDLAEFHSATVTIAGATVIVIRDQPLSGAHYRLIVPEAQAADLWSALLDLGAPSGLIPAGSLTYNALRIRAGHPAAGRELSTDYLPLEVGLWDEISFTKGCYTGQEIVARMESRGRLAKVMVRLRLDAAVAAPAAISTSGREIGTLTSSVETPDGDKLGIGVVKLAAAQPGTSVTIGDTSATIVDFAGSPPPYVREP